MGGDEELVSGEMGIAKGMGDPLLRDERDGGEGSTEASSLVRRISTSSISVCK